MRSDPLVFAAANEAPAKEPRFVVAIMFDLASLYVTSHTDIQNVPGVVLAGKLQAPSAISQRIIPDEGRSEIGAFEFTLVDQRIASDFGTGFGELGFGEGPFGGSALVTFTDEVRAKLNSGRGLRGKTVQLWVGYKGLDFTQFVLFQTQVISHCSYKGGVYRVQCQDITREQRKEIFEPWQTTLAAVVNPGDTTVTVASAAAAAPVAHGAGWSDAPNQTVYYFRIGDTIYRATGKTGTTFTGVTQGVFNTRAVQHTFDPATPQERRPKVEEFIYLELPAPKLAYAVLTGIIHGTPNVLPAHWHCGIPASFVRLSDFTGIGSDLWNTADDTAGFPLRFEGLKKQTGQRFLEKQVYAALMCFSPVYSDGTLGLQRLPALLPDSPAIATITERETVSVGELDHDYDSLHNFIRILWGYDLFAEEFRRRNAIVDAVSESIHGKAPVLEFEFRGIHSGIHTDAMIEARMDALRDAYTFPPQRLTARVLPSLNKYEVADIVRVKVAGVRDFAGPSESIDRSMMIMRRAIDFATGEVSWDLMGSTRRPSTRPPTSGLVTPLPDGFYNALGTQLSTVIGMTGNTVNAGSHTINGSTDMNAAPSIFYHLGDLTVPDGATINITGNVQLRIRGFVTLNGDIVGTGGGKAGVADSGAVITSPILGNAGFMGATRGWDGIDVTGPVGARATSVMVNTVPAGLTPAAHDARNGFPQLTLRVSGTTLLGIPSDMRGGGGGPGGRYKQTLNGSPDVVGGSGANGGAGLVIVCRGMSFGASASIVLDGNTSATTAQQVFLSAFEFHPGAGGGGGAGALLVLLDGNALSEPNIGGRFFARSGSVPVQGTPLSARRQLVVRAEAARSGYQDEQLISGEDLSDANYRIQYIPESQTPAVDADFRPPSPTQLSVTGQIGFNQVRIALPPFDQFDFAEVYASLDNNRANAVLLTSGKLTEITHELAAGATRYYWCRTVKVLPDGRDSVSAWLPESATGGVQGIRGSTTTADIAPNAATDLFMIENNSSVFAPFNNETADQAGPAWVNFQPTVTCQIELTVTVQARAEPGDSFQYFRMRPYIKASGSSTPDDTGVYTEIQQNVWQEYTLSAVFDVTAGVTYAVGGWLYYSDTGGSTDSTWRYRDYAIRVAVIKR